VLIIFIELHQVIAHDRSCMRTMPGVLEGRCRLGLAQRTSPPPNGYGDQLIENFAE
jgi:hypothetical protein